METGKEILALGKKPIKVQQMAFSPDERTLAGATADGTIHLWEVATGKECGEFSKSLEKVRTIVFSPDGKTVAVGMEDPGVRISHLFTSISILSLQNRTATVTFLAFSSQGKSLASGDDSQIFIWDLESQLRNKAAILEAAELEKSWKDLASSDARKAYAAIGVLVEAPGQAVPFLQEQIQKDSAVDVNQIARLIADLGRKSDTAQGLEVQDTAKKELIKLGYKAVPALRQTHNNPPSRPVYWLVDRILEDLDGEKAPWSRALQALEVIGTHEAHKALEKLAKGPAESLVTREAKVSLQRLVGRTVKEPVPKKNIAKD